MITERNALGISRYLKDTEETIYDTAYLEVNGIKITYPGLAIVQYAAYNEPISKDFWEAYESMTQLFSEDEIPEEWIEVLTSVEAKRKEAGLDNPIDMIAAAFFILDEFVEDNEIAQFDRSPSDYLDLASKEEVKNKINDILNSKYRKPFISIMTYLTPDRSPDWSSSKQLQELISHLDLENALIVDLGCGIGSKTPDWVEDVDAKSIGIDRQYHPEWYVDWHEGRNGTKFLCADARRTPLKKECADIVILDFVVPHVSEEGLLSIIKESGRIVKIGGILAVTPQQEDFRGLDKKNDSYWRFFVKTTNSKGEIMFKRQTLEELTKKDR